MKRIAKSIVATLGSGASAALVVAQAGSTDTTRAWLTGIAVAFVTGLITYRVPNKIA